MTVESGSTASLADGVFERGEPDSVLRFRRRFAHPIARVWASLTEPAELINWWGEATVALVAGGEFTVRWLNTDTEGNYHTLRHTVSTLRPPYLLVTEGEPHGTLRWALTEDGDGTILEFSSTVAIPTEFITRTMAGWHWHLDTLSNALAGERVDLAALVGWTEIHQHYLAMIG